MPFPRWSSRITDEPGMEENEKRLEQHLSKFHSQAVQLKVE